MNEDFLDLLRALSDAGARFLVVGAHAMAVHGVPRATQDLDVFIEPVAANATRVWDALLVFGAPVAALGVTQADLVRPGVVIQLGVPPRRIDLLTEITGVSFDAAWSGRLEEEIGGVRVPFLGREALIQNKRAVARAKDLSDLDALGERPRSHG